MAILPINWGYLNNNLRQPACHETGLVDAVGVGEHLPGKIDHVLKIEAPFTRALGAQLRPRAFR
jgi:hypothetical protein